MQNNEFPYEGEIFRSKNKKYSPIIVFIHFYGGSKRLLKRHIRFVNDLGFDSFAFNLAEDQIRPWDLPLTGNLKFGMKHVFADQIEEVLNLLPDKKILFTFSNPSASAIEAIRRRNASDVIGLICDSGPSGKFVKSAYNLFTHERIKPFPIRIAATPLLSLFWSPKLHKDIHTDLNCFPQNFPLLSIIGWKDVLIPPSHIEAAFSNHTQLNWTKLSLPQCGHLVGLRDFPSEYKPAVQNFLEKLAANVLSDR